VPFHAAGVYFGENIECCSDYIVSSYTPTLSALRRARTSLAPVPRRSLVLLAAGNPQGAEQSFMPGVLEEITAVARTARAADHMEVLEYGLISGAKVHEVTDALSRAHIVHLAGHMHTENQHHSQPHPLDLGFFLADGKLTVSEIMDVELRHAFLLFLSSCDTAKGDENQPDQAVHLAAAMLFSGFRNVIATMWCVHKLIHRLCAFTCPQVDV
jgi:CHAT domain-containing protein